MGKAAKWHFVLSSAYLWLNFYSFFTSNYSLMALRRVVAPLEVGQAVRKARLQLDEVGQHLCELLYQQQVV